MPPVSPRSDRSPARLLCLSNGHGEDRIALRILQALQAQLGGAIAITALPLVGRGNAYLQAQIPLIGPSRDLPSGGFVYMDGRELVRDLKGGLLGLSWQQWQAVKAWANAKQDGQRNLVLAVGDIVPLVLGWLSRTDYAFVGTAKSDYYLRDEGGPLVRQGKGKRESKAKSVYLAPDRWLMSRPGCKAVFPRDRLTTQCLKRWPIPAFDLGNPMMDGLEPQHPAPMKLQRDYLKLLLLPGSRSPEAYRNWELILESVKLTLPEYRDRALVFLAAIDPGLDLASLAQPVQIQGWQPDGDREAYGGWLPAGAMAFQRRQHRLLLSQKSFGDYLHGADGAIAMAGTATEQCVGLGKPAFILPGKGPQFNAQ
ncbi:MAG: hypothetical protein HC771_17595, partial [Synechococcales cyanobacterium CRU_2_2]|nr:hypothetical protein [Synechococcales cyanobacterium CRU_2_2]